VVAEGVEDQRSADALADMGCDMLQGYFIGRPAAPTSCATLCSHRDAAVPAPATAAERPRVPPRSGEQRAPLMFMPFAFLLLLVTVPLAGGRLSACRPAPRGRGSIVLALGLQVLMASVLPVRAAGRAARAAHRPARASYATIAWTLWLNRAVPGLLLIALGGGTNAAVIALNGGTLPADPDALAEAGFTVEPTSTRTAASSTTRSSPGSAT
jgi:hypothetical protein